MLMVADLGEGGVHKLLMSAKFFFFFFELLDVCMRSLVSEVLVYQK